MDYRSPLGIFRMILKASDPGFIGGSMTSTERLVYLALAVHADQQGRCWPTIDTLGRCTGLRRRAVIYTLRSLDQKGFIGREVRPPKTTIYTLPSLGALAAPCTSSTVHSMHGDSALDAHELPKELTTEAGEKGSLHAYTGVGAYEEPDPETDPEGFERWAIMQEAGI